MPEFTDSVKVDTRTLQVTKTVPETTKQEKYDYAFLKQQLISIQAQKDRDNAARDAELAEVQALIVEADKLGITDAVIAEDTPKVEPSIEPAPEEINP